MTNPTAEPAASTVFDQRTFSAVKGETVGAAVCNETGSDGIRGGAAETVGVLRVNVPTKEWMSLIGVSAGDVLVLKYATRS
jgi:hypothetical protein